MANRRCCGHPIEFRIFVCIPIPARPRVELFVRGVPDVFAVARWEVAACGLCSGWWGLDDVPLTAEQQEQISEAVRMVAIERYPGLPR